MSNKSGNTTPQSGRSTRSSARRADQQQATGNVSPSGSTQSRDTGSQQPPSAAEFVSPTTPKNKPTSRTTRSGQVTPQAGRPMETATPKSGGDFSQIDEGRRSPTIVSDAPSSPLAYGSVATSSQQRRFIGAPRSPGTALSSLHPASSTSASRFGTSRTPHRRRADIGAYFSASTNSPRRLVNAPHASQSQSQQIDAPLATQSQGEDAMESLAPQLVVWGTDVSVARCQERFRRFLREFRLSDFAENGGSGGIEDGDAYANVAEPAAPFYMQKLDEIRLIEEPFVALNCSHLKQFDAALYRQLVAYPVEVIPALDIAVNQEFFTKYPDTDLEHQIQVLPFNVDKVRNMRSLNPEHIDQLIGINGMVIRTSAVIPEMREGYFECTVCAHAVTVEIDRGYIREPTSCAHCQSAHSLALIHNRSSYTDKQLIKVQESPDEMPAGQTPITALVFAHNELVDRVQPGDRVHVTGIFRAVPVRLNPRQRTVRAVYRTYIDALHLRKVTENKLASPADAAAGERQTDSLGWLTAERRSQLDRLHSAPDLYERLAHALAPSIYEHEDVKKGILLQLFGGTPKRNAEAERGTAMVGRGQFRAEINVLLCGDPSTSKSQLLRYVHSIVPRSQYASGKGTSAVGLTAYVTKDPDTRQVALQTGALVLADNGVCCIDEFDKMSEAARTILHEALEQQTISIAKAGIICTLNARTSVLAAANPTESRWNMRKTIVENIELPHTLLSRFDLIFLLLDPQDDAHDSRLARHLVALYHKAPTGSEADTQDAVDFTLLRDYIAYSRAEYHPRLSEEACESLVSEYVDMRRLSAGRGQVTAYPRQLESLIRLAEAHARLRWSDQVQLLDVREARRLHREALKQSATDPQTGLIDIGILATGMSASRRRRQRELADALRALITSKQRKTLTVKSLLLEARTSVPLQLTRDLFEDALNLLQDDNVIMWSENTIRVV